jgi:hypothetical protein
MNKFSKELIERLTEACEHAEGNVARVRIGVVDVGEQAERPDEEGKRQRSSSAARRRMG